MQSNGNNVMCPVCGSTKFVRQRVYTGEGFLMGLLWGFLGATVFATGGMIMTASVILAPLGIPFFFMSPFLGIGIVFSVAGKYKRLFAVCAKCGVRV